MKCVLCASQVGVDQKYCIRDFKITETKFQWWLRHVCGLLTFNFWDRRKLATILPLCNKCGELFINQNEILNP